MHDPVGHASDRVGLPVTRRNGRNYVQASQMIARICDLAGDGAYPSRASFRRITTRSVYATRHDEPGLSLGSIACVNRDGATPVWHLHEGEGEAPSDTAEPRWSVSKVAQEGAFDAAFTFTGAASLEDRLEVVVRALRTLHEALDDSVRDVWFSSLRGATIRSSEDPAGTLETRELRRLKAGDRQLTLIGVMLSGHDAGQEGVFTFACRIGGEGA